MTAQLVESFEIAPETRHFVFSVPEYPRLDFKPGQFFSLTQAIEAKPITRAYSIAGVPDGNRFELCLNRVQDGRLSPYLFAMQPGDQIQVAGPYGTFVLRDFRDTLLIATGTGIAPFRGMLLDRLAQDPDHCYTLLFGVRHEESLLYREIFESLQQKHSNFRFIPTLTRPVPGWTGATGRVQAHVREALGDQRDLDVYICGLKEMVTELRAVLKELGLERKQIQFEKYD